MAIFKIINTKFFILNGLLLSASCHLFASGNDSLIRYAEKIDREDLKRHLYRLASREFEGRETARPGQKMAAEYLAGQFKEMGVSPYLDSTFFFKYPLIISSPDISEFILNGKPYTFMKDYYYFPGFRDTAINIHEAVFAGYGITDGKYDSYKGADVKEKAVVILPGEPYNEKTKKFILTGTEKPSKWSKSGFFKQALARKKEAALLLVVTDNMEDNIESNKRHITSAMYALGGDTASHTMRIPVFYISTEMAVNIFSKNKKDFSIIFRKISAKSKSKPMLLESDISVEVRRKKETSSAENVLAFFEGTDKKDEVVIITAHYDHLGKKENEIYFGADDDASGTSALLEIAEALSAMEKDGKKSSRSILIMPVSGEEKGLLGSEYYTLHPMIPLDKTVADLNIDMIGRLDTAHKKDPYYVYIIGSDKISTELHKINEEANKNHTQLDLDYTYNSPADPNRFYYRSDHYNFAKNNVPVIFYFTGVHEDYHKPTDTPDKIHFEKMERITRLVFYTAWELANRPERIKKDVENVFENY